MKYQEREKYISKTFRCYDADFKHGEPIILRSKNHYQVLAKLRNNKTPHLMVGWVDEFYKTAGHLVYVRAHSNNDLVISDYSFRVSKKPNPKMEIETNGGMSPELYYYSTEMVDPNGFKYIGWRIRANKDRFNKFSDDDIRQYIKHLKKLL